MIEATLIILILTLLVLGGIEYYNHTFVLSQLPIRIHVNGARGKSSVTRLIAAGLREGGLKTIAKTTGSAPRIIDEFGKDPAIKESYQALFKCREEILKSKENFPQDL